MKIKKELIHRRIAEYLDIYAKRYASANKNEVLEDDACAELRSNVSMLLWHAYNKGLTYDECIDMAVTAGVSLAWHVE